MLADEAYAVTALRIPWGNRGSDTALPLGCGFRLADGRVTLQGDTRGLASFHPRLSRALAGASSASWC
jgi:hypothetical protein